MNVLKRLHAAMSPAAMLVAILALLVAAGGAGYAAGQIGTSGIRNNAITAKKIHKNAVTTKKIKNGAVTGAKVADHSLSDGDLVREAPYVRVGGPGGVPFANGGEGDCVWQSIAVTIPGLTSPAYRIDRSRNVHLAGVAGVLDGPGGDAACDGSAVGEVEDYVAFVLPAAYRPATTRYFGTVDEGLLVVGKNGFAVGSTVFPAGAVAVLNPNQAAILDGIEFEAASSSLSPTARKAHGSAAEQERLAAQLFGKR